MKKLLLLLLLPFAVSAQTVTPSWKVFGAGSRTIQYSFPGQTGGPKSLIDSVDLYLRFIQKSDSAHYVTLWQFLHGNNTVGGNWLFNGRFIVDSHYRAILKSDSTRDTYIGSVRKESLGSGLTELFGIYYQTDFGTGFKSTNKANGSGKKIISLGYNLGGDGNQLRLDTGMTYTKYRVNRITQSDSTTGHFRRDSLPVFNHSIDVSDRLLTSSDTGTNTLPSLYSLEHRTWNFYNPVTFHQNVDMTGAEIHNALLYQVGDAYGDPTKSVNIQNFGGTFQVSRSTTAGFTLDPVTNKLYTANSGGAGPGIPYLLATDVAIPTVESFGAVGNGSTDDIAAFNAAVASGKAFQGTVGKNYKISTNFTLAPGQAYWGNGSSLLINNTHAINLSDSSQVHDVVIIGSGKGTFHVNEIGIYQKKAIATTVSNVTGNNVSYAVFYADSTVNLAGSGNINYRSSLIDGLRAINCGAGIVTGKRGEYIYSTKPRMQGCDTAIVNRGGNNTFTGGDVTWNTNGVYVEGGGVYVNDAHSGVFNMTITHNTNSNVIALNVSNFYSFGHNLILVGQIFVTNCNLISFSGGAISPRTSLLGIVNSGSNLWIDGVIFQSSTPYTESGGGTHNFFANTLSYTNATDYALYCGISNTRITKRVSALATNSATYSINTDNIDIVHITAQTATITSLTTTGTPVDGDQLRISITATATTGFTLDPAKFEGSGGITLSTTTSGTVRLDMIFIWNTETSKWREVGVS